MNNVGLLLNNTNQADFLRQTIIEQNVRNSNLPTLYKSHNFKLFMNITDNFQIPSFAPKLSSKIKKIGQDIFDRLNKEQVRAILQAVAADKYILIRGMPGAGKFYFYQLLLRF